MHYSWILPIWNEVSSLPQLVDEIARVMRGKSYEIVAVDDGSTDETKRVLLGLARRRTHRIPFVHLILLFLPSHLGKWAALRAGLTRARGDILITLDADLQDDPNEAMKLIEKLKEGYDLVSGWRRDRKDSLYKIVISRMGNSLVSLLFGRQYHDLNAPMKAFRQSILAHLPHEGSLFRFSLLFADQLGFKTIEVPIRHHPRIYGRSKFGLIKYLRILYDLLLIRLLFTGSSRLSSHTLPRDSKDRR